MTKIYITRYWYTGTILTADADIVDKKRAVLPNSPGIRSTAGFLSDQYALTLEAATAKIKKKREARITKLEDEIRERQEEIDKLRGLGFEVKEF